MSIGIDIGVKLKEILSAQLPNFNFNVVGHSESSRDEKKLPSVAITVSEPLMLHYNSKLFQCSGQIIASVFQPDDPNLTTLSSAADTISQLLDAPTITIPNADSIAVVLEAVSSFVYQENHVVSYTWDMNIVGRKKIT